MTPAERQRRHREKKYAARAESGQSIAAWFQAHRLRPGDLVRFVDKDFESLDPADIEPFDPAELEPWKPNSEE